MSRLAFILGLASAIPLLILLLWTWRGSGPRIWPTPQPGSWQSLVFWPLFRTLNASAFLAAVSGEPDLVQVPPWARMIALLALLGAGALYLYALHALGHANTYCERDGLVTRGIYRWTRNPQYATVIPVYVALALAADNWATAVLCLALVAVYVLMALNEEPWLAAAYGGAYLLYCRRVPRFFNWRRALVLLLSVLRHADRAIAARLAGSMKLGLASGSGRKRL